MTRTEGLRTLREQAGLSQAELGALSGLSQHDISVIERAGELAADITAALLRHELDLRTHDHQEVAA